MTDQSIIRVFPGWRVVREIGAGGFGKVYEIERDRFGKIEKAAVKVMNIPNDRSVISEMREDGYDDESIKSRLKSDMDTFAMEYDNMRKVVHTNIVNCDDIEYEANEDGFGYTVYLKMELLMPLMASLKNGYDREKTTVALAKDICKALERCESKNIVHRDIKPQNLFVNEYGEYKLGDFGIAREMDHATNATKTGTYKYMAPEVYNNQPYDHNVDIYSLGLVMYWLLNEKRMPFVPLPPAVPTAQEEEAAKSKRLRGEKLSAPKYGSGLQPLSVIMLLLRIAILPDNQMYPAAGMTEILPLVPVKPKAILLSAESTVFLIRVIERKTTRRPAAIHGMTTVRP